ncbi:MAG: hypothetical protein PHY15_00775 [Eubacteriales bacterium]|nr:hypothetical protein [Eubacteriales bacterium]MDD4475278.1 hypothetical protein [Eubacteriales bacterium]
MKNNKTKILCAFLSLFILTAFSSCGAEIKNFRKLSDGRLWDRSTDTYYTPCSVSLRAYELGDIYAKNETYNYYKVNWELPERFVADEDTVLGGVYRNSEIPEINISNFGAVAAKIYVTGEIRQLVDELLASPDIIGDVSRFTHYEDGTERVNAVVDAMISGEEKPIPVNIDEDRVFEIGLLSADYPGLVYTVIFMLDINGDAYLYDRSDKKCVACPVMIKDYMLGTSSETSEDISK